MIFIANRQGTIEHVIDEPVYQSSTGASRVVLIAPFENVMATVAFRLPNGILTTVHFAQPNMVETTLGGEILDKDGKKYNAWTYLLGQDITAYAGIVGVQFFLYTNPDKILATYTTQFNIQKGVVPQLPTTPTSDVYTEILDYLTNLQANIKQIVPIQTVNALPTNAENIVIYRLQKDDNGVKNSEYWIFNPDDKTPWQQVNASILNANPDGATNKNMLYLYNGNLSYINEDGDVVIITGNSQKDHSALLNRDKPDQHPITAITDLKAKLDSLQTGVTDNGTAITGSNARLTALEQSVSTAANADTIAKRDNKGHIETKAAETATQATNKEQVEEMISGKTLQVVEVTQAEADSKQLTAENLDKIKKAPDNCLVFYTPYSEVMHVGKKETGSETFEGFSIKSAGVDEIEVHEMKVTLSSGAFEIKVMPLHKLEEIRLTTPSGTLNQAEINTIKFNFFLCVIRITTSSGVLDFHPMEVSGDDYNFVALAVDKPEANKTTVYEMTANVKSGNYSTTDMVVESYVTLRKDLATKAEVTEQIENLNTIKIWNKSTVNQGVINATESTVQTVCTDYIVANVGRQPKSKDGLIITLTDQANDKVQYMYTEASKEWVDIGKATSGVDLSAYYTKTEADGKFATPSQIPTDNKNLKNGAGYIKNEPNAFDYANLKNKPTDYITETVADGKYVAQSTAKGTVYGVGTAGQENIKLDYAKTNNTIPQRNDQGNFEVATPTKDNETANKAYVDSVKTYADDTFVKKDNIPLATADKVGGIKAGPATGDDTQPVHINDKGELFTKPSGGSSGVTEHNLLTNRDKPDQHPIEAITGLKAKLDSLQTGVTDNGTAISNVSAKATTNAANIEKKREKITNNSKVYTTDSKGSQTETAYSSAPAANAIAAYDNNSRLKTNAPAADNDSANKQYVDSADTNNLNAAKAYADSQINAKLGATFKPVGSVAFSALPQTPNAENLGNVWNITNEFTTDNRFNNPGLIFPAGTNVACVKETDGTFKYDTLSGTVDLSNYYTKGESDGKYGAKSAVEANTAAIAKKANQSDLTALTTRVTNTEGKASANELNISTNATNLQNHMKDKINPHNVTKEQLGLGNVNNIAINPDDFVKKSGTSGIIYGTNNIGDSTTIEYTHNPKNEAIPQYVGECIETGEPQINLDCVNKQYADKTYVVRSSVSNIIYATDKNGAPFKIDYNNMGDNIHCKPCNVNLGDHKFYTKKPDWNAAKDTDGEILNKPTIPDTSNLLSKSTLKNSLYGVGETGQQQQVEFNYNKVNGTIPRRNAQGNFEVSEPRTDNDCVNLKYFNDHKAPSYTLPVATNDRLGGVKAASKTSDDTQEVKVDSNGKLWVKPGGGETKVVQWKRYSCFFKTKNEGKDIYPKLIFYSYIVFYQAEWDVFYELYRNGLVNGAIISPMFVTDLDYQEPSSFNTIYMGWNGIKVETINIEAGTTKETYYAGNNLIAEVYEESDSIYTVDKSGSR